MDDSDKFDRIPDEELLTLVQKQTFKYFWNFGHEHSGMARERTTSADVEGNRHCLRQFLLFGYPVHGASDGPTGGAGENTGCRAR